jgi:copper(I)-binding protein
MRPKLLAPAAGLIFAIAAGAQAQTGGVEIKEAWARATPGGAQTAAVYATIVAPAGDRLTAVSTAAAQKAGLHTMTIDSGVMKMRQVDGIDLPPGQTVTLKPGGYHIMLTGLARPLKEGESVNLSLTFEKAGVREVSAPVLKVGAMGPGDAHGGTDMPMKH